MRPNANTGSVIGRRVVVSGAAHSASGYLDWGVAVVTFAALPEHSGQWRLMKMRGGTHGFQAPRHGRELRCLVSRVVVDGQWVDKGTTSWVSFVQNKI